MSVVLILVEMELCALISSISLIASAILDGQAWYVIKISMSVQVLHAKMAASVMTLSMDTIALVSLALLA